MITGRKVLPRKIRTTPPETLVARLSQPHLIPRKDNIFQEIDHNTIGYLDGLAATSNPAFGRDRQTSLSGTAMDINTMTSTYHDGIGFVPDKLSADDDECSCGETNCDDPDVPTAMDHCYRCPLDQGVPCAQNAESGTDGVNVKRCAYLRPEPSVTNIGVLNVTAVDPVADAIDIWAKPIGDAIAFYENFVKSVKKMNSSMKELQEAFDVDLPFDMAPGEEELRSLVDEIRVVPQVYDGDRDDDTFNEPIYVKEVSTDHGATWQDSINTSIRTDDLWRLIFEKYRLLSTSMLLRRKDEISHLFNTMINARQEGKIEDELFDSYIRRRKAVDARNLDRAPKNRPTENSGND